MITITNDIEVGLLISRLLAVEEDFSDLAPLSFEHEAECRRVGERLNEIGGWDLMSSAHRVVRSSNYAFARALDRHWDRIGDWSW